MTHNISSASDAHRQAQILRGLEERVRDLEQERVSEGHVKTSRQATDNAVSTDAVSRSVDSSPQFEYAVGVPSGRPSPTAYDPDYSDGTGDAHLDDPAPPTATGWGVSEWTGTAGDTGSDPGFGESFGDNFGG